MNIDSKNISMTSDMVRFSLNSKYNNYTSKLGNVHVPITDWIYETFLIHKRSKINVRSSVNRRSSNLWINEIANVFRVPGTGKIDKTTLRVITK